MKITGYGTASVKIEADGQIFFFDPYHKDLVGVEESAKQRRAREQAFLKAERVFLTHGHFDHMGSICSLYRGRSVHIYCTRTPGETLRRLGFPAQKIGRLCAGMKLQFGGCTIEAYHTKHCRFDIGKILEVVLRHRIWRRLGSFLRLTYLRLCYRSADECLMYEICAEGKRIQLLGSAGLDARVRYRKGADALILPYQGRSDMAAYCLGIVETLEPKCVYLNHYDDAFPPLTCTEDTQPFVRLLGQMHPEIACAVLAEGTEMEL